MIEVNQIIQGDCFNVMPEIDTGSVNMVLTDMPYGITACKWDTVPDLDKLWIELKRIGKPNCAYIMTASQPFTTDLINSNRKMFKYEWIWEKSHPNNIFMANIQPMKYHENIIVFGDHVNYFPIKWKGILDHNKKGYHGKSDHFKKAPKVFKSHHTESKYPRSIIKSNCQNRANQSHPTQKPVALFEYLIRTYSNEGDLVFDGFAGSCTTAVACYNTNRKYICVELDEGYCNKGRDRIKEAQRQLKLAI